MTRISHISWGGYDKGFYGIDKNYTNCKNKIATSSEKKMTKIKTSKETYRGSNFRGVSINGFKWQVFVVINSKKHYIGQMKTEEEAAKLYDKLILIHIGMTAKLNFNYSAGEIERIIEEMSGYNLNSQDD